MGNTTSGKRHNSGDDSGPTITANRLGDNSLEEGDFDPNVFKVRRDKNLYFCYIHILLYIIIFGRFRVSTLEI